MDLRAAISGSAFEPLTPERDHELRAIMANDPTPEQIQAVRDELVRRHLRMVLHIGRGYRHRLSDEDILSVGSLALTQAVSRWDPEKGSLYGWARRWVTTALTKAVDASRTIRVPEAVANAAALAARDVQQAEAEAGRRLSAAEREAVEAGRWTFDKMPSASSLDAPIWVDDERVQPADILPSTDPGPDDIALAAERRALVDEALGELDQIERMVVKARFGFNGDRRTLADLGASYGITAEGMRRIEITALAKLRHPAARRRLDGLL